MFKRFKIAIIFTIIASFFAMFLSFFGALAMLVDEGFDLFLFSSGLLDVNVPNEALIMLRITLIIISFLSNIIFIPTLVIAFICLRHNKLSNEAFKKKMALHIVLTVLCQLSISVSNLALETFFPNEAVSSVLDLIRMVSVCFYFASIILILTSIIPNAVVVNRKKKMVINESNVVVNNNELESNVVVDNNELESNNNDNKEDLEEIYTLLAKLEKEYKNNEINEEDYQRMKQTLLEKIYK